MIPVLALLLAGLVETEDDRARQRAIHELQNRLGLRRDPDSPLRARVLYALEHVLPRHPLLIDMFLEFVWVYVADGGEILQRSGVFDTSRSASKFTVPPFSWVALDTALEDVPQNETASSLDDSALVLVPWLAAAIRKEFEADLSDMRREVAAGDIELWYSAGPGSDLRPVHGEMTFDQWMSTLHPAYRRVKGGHADTRFHRLDTILRDEIHILLDEIAAQLPSLVDFVTEACPPDLMSLSWPQLWAASRTWHDEFRKAGEYQAPIADGWVVARWPDGTHVDRLVTKEQLAAEGDSMGHCVGGYWAQVRDEDTLIFSVRSKEGVPVATIEWDKSVAQVVQVQAPGDTDIGEGDAFENNALVGARVYVFCDRFLGSWKKGYGMQAERSITSALGGTDDEDFVPSHMVVKQVLAHPDRIEQWMFEPMRSALSRYVSNPQFSNVRHPEPRHVDLDIAEVLQLDVTLSFDTVGYHVVLTMALLLDGRVEFWVEESRILGVTHQFVPVAGSSNPLATVDERHARAFANLGWYRKPVWQFLNAIPTSAFGRDKVRPWRFLWLLERGQGMEVLVAPELATAPQEALVQKGIVRPAGRGRFVLRSPGENP